MKLGSQHLPPLCRLAQAPPIHRQAGRRHLAPRPSVERRPGRPGHAPHRQGRARLLAAGRDPGARRQPLRPARRHDWLRAQPGRLHLRPRRQPGPAHQGRCPGRGRCCEPGPREGEKVRRYGEFRYPPGSAGALASARGRPRTSSVAVVAAPPSAASTPPRWERRSNRTDRELRNPDIPRATDTGRRPG